VRISSAALRAQGAARNNQHRRPKRERPAQEPTASAPLLVNASSVLQPNEASLEGKLAEIYEAGDADNDSARPR
jgi:hypothetical protein